MSRDFRTFFCLADSTWAQSEQTKTVLLTFFEDNRRQKKTPTTPNPDVNPLSRKLSYVAFTYINQANKTLVAKVHCSTVHVVLLFFHLIGALQYKVGK